MLYNIKINKVFKQYVEQEPNRKDWNRTVVFSVAELGYQDSISIPLGGFSKKKAKEAIKAKIRDFLVKKAEEEANQEEYTEEIV